MYLAKSDDIVIKIGLVEDNDVTTTQVGLRDTMVSGAHRNSVHFM